MSQVTPDPIWSDDLLDRRKTAEFLATFLRSRSKELAYQKQTRSFVLNIDARWGDGKTFFLTRLRKMLAAQGHIAVYVDCWRDDFADDPLIAVMAAIDEEMKSRLGSKAPASKAFVKARTKAGSVAKLVVKGLALRGLSWALTEGIATAIGEAVTNVSPTAATGAGDAVAAATKEAVEKQIEAKEASAVDDFRTEKASLDEFRKSLADFVTKVEETDGIASPLFVLVDELDRCRPPYAIAMLERIKHLFELPNVVFVVATDSEQLAHSIRGVYGSEFDGRRYLHRFFDRTFQFEPPDPATLVRALFVDTPVDESKLSAPRGYSPIEFIAAYLAASGLGARSIKRIVDTVATIVTTWTDRAQIELLVLMPIVSTFVETGTIPTVDRVLAEPFYSKIGVSFPSRTSSSEYPQVRTASELAGQLWALANEKTLVDLTSYGTGSATAVSDYWIGQRFRQEHLARNNGTYYPGDPEPVSMIRRYPELVRQAGLLSLGPTKTPR